MARKRTNWFGGRGMLNLPGYQSTAAIVAEIEDTGPVRQEQRRVNHLPAVTLQISNCDRSISFEIEGFRCYAADLDEAMTNDLHKIDMLIGTLQDFRDGLVKEQNRFRRRKATS